MLDKEISLNLDPQRMDHGYRGEQAIFPGGMEGMVGNGETKPESSPLPVQDRSFPHIFQQTPVIRSQILQRFSTQDIFPDGIKGGQETGETEFAATIIDYLPIHVRCMKPAKHDPIQDMTQIQAFMQKMEIGMDDHEQR